MSNLIDIPSLHHITIVCANAQSALDFYTKVLELHFPMKTVNLDVPDHYYFGEEAR